MIRYVEHATRSKFRDGSGNEDRLVLADTVCAVIDGATAKPGQAARSGANIAALIAGALEEIGKHNGAHTEADRRTSPDSAFDAQTLVAQVTAHVRAALDLPVGEHLSDGAVARSSAAVAIYLASRRQLIRVGDCHLAINGQAYRGTKAIDTLLSEVRSLYLRLSRDAGTAVAVGADDPGRAVIMPLLTRQAALQNRADLSPYGYGCIDGTDVPPAFIEVWDIPPDTEVVLCSDGYLTPAPTLAGAEAELSAALATDPDCIGVLKGTKGVRADQISFDDRSYLRFRTG
jgi:hypothetical protein